MSFPFPSCWTILMLMSLVGVVSQGVPEVLVGEEGPGHLVDLLVGPDGFEVLHIVPEVGGGVGPVGVSRRLLVRH